MRRKGTATSPMFYPCRIRLKLNREEALSKPEGNHRKPTKRKKQSRTRKRKY